MLIYSGAAPGSTVLPQMPGTVLREQLTSLPGKAALLFHLPPHHPSLPYPDCQGRKIPSRQGGSLTTVEQCPLVAAGYMPPLSIPNYCPVPVPKARRKKSSSKSTTPIQITPQTHRVTEREADPLKHPTSRELASAPKPGCDNAVLHEKWQANDESPSQQ